MTGLDEQHLIEGPMTGLGRHFEIAQGKSDLLHPTHGARTSEAVRQTLGLLPVPGLN